jgi:hypothetical protein
VSLSGGATVEVPRRATEEIGLDVGLEAEACQGGGDRPSPLGAEKQVG